MNQSLTQPVISSETQSRSRSGVLAAALAAALFGVFLIFGAGFAGSDVLHAAAHDSRHAFSFPCH